MDENKLYQLGFRLPHSVIPKGLIPLSPRIGFDEKLGWFGEYWYFRPQDPVPHMYAKLCVPEGRPVEIRKLTDETQFSDCGIPPLSHTQMEYLTQCVRMIHSNDPAQKVLDCLKADWMMLCSEAQRIWFRIHKFMPVPVQDRRVPPPKCLVEYWTADKVLETCRSPACRGPYQDPPTDDGSKLWQFGKDCQAAKTCIPKELVPGLPRLSYDSRYGWIVEYWYYYGITIFIEPQFYLKVCLATGMLLEMKCLTDTLSFRESWPKDWIGGVYEREARYLDHCAKLLKEERPSAQQLLCVQGMWLEAHPEPYIYWLVGNSHLNPEAIHWLLSPDRHLTGEILKNLWLWTMVQGVETGDAQIAGLCAARIAAFYDKIG